MPEDRFTEIVASMSVTPKRQKICHDDRAIVKLETIGVHNVKLTKVTLIVSDQECADICAYGGLCETYWEEPWKAEKMYDHHLEWIKSLPGGVSCQKKS